MSFASFRMKVFEDMASNGLPFTGGELILDGAFHSYSAKGGKESEWYIVSKNISKEYGISFACTYGTHKGGLKYTVFSNSNNKASSQELKKFTEKYVAEIEKKQAEVVENRIKALSNTVRYGWYCTKPIYRLSDSPPKKNTKGNGYGLPSDHKFWRYLDKKGLNISSAYGARFRYWSIRIKGKKVDCCAIILPIINIKAELVNLQIITVTDDGVTHKRFVQYCEKKGMFGVLDQNFETYFNTVDSNTKFAITEGWANACGVQKKFEKKNKNLFRILFALDAGNIKKVVKNLRSKFPDNEIYIFSDPDEVGEKAADEACSLYRNCKKISISKISFERN